MSLLGPFTSPVTAGSRGLRGAVSSARSTDWVARLCDVQPDGRSFTLCDGILRVPEGAEDDACYEIDLWSELPPSAVRPDTRSTWSSRPPGRAMLMLQSTAVGSAAVRLSRPSAECLTAGRASQVVPPVLTEAAPPSIVWSYGLVFSNTKRPRLEPERCPGRQETGGQRVPLLWHATDVAAACGPRVRAERRAATSSRRSGLR